MDNNNNPLQHTVLSILSSYQLFLKLFAVVFCYSDHTTRKKRLFWPLHTWAMYLSAPVREQDNATEWCGGATGSYGDHSTGLKDDNTTGVWVPVGLQCQAMHHSASSKAESAHIHLQQPSLSGGGSESSGGEQTDHGGSWSGRQLQSKSCKSWATLALVHGACATTRTWQGSSKTTFALLKNLKTMVNVLALCAWITLSRTMNSIADGDELDCSIENPVDSN